MLAILSEYATPGSLAVAFLALLAIVAATVHAVIHKRDSRSAVTWVCLILLAPLVGATLYLLFGINRIRRRAVRLRGERHHAGGAFTLDSAPHSLAPGACFAPPGGDSGLEEAVDDDPIRALNRLAGRVSSRPLAPGNSVRALVDGDEAYPIMLEAIESARHSVGLSTYIFDHDAAGVRFLEALARAHQRGVAVRVLIDAVGARYSLVSMIGALQRARVRVAAFLPTRLPWRWPFMNLRTHRKILTVDGRIGFTGGMNLRVGHVLRDRPRAPVRDLHFLVEGPVVAQMQETFVDDWEFATHERLQGEAWFPPLAPVGSVVGRALPDGPDESFDPLRMVRLGALAVARSRVLLITPYFLPDAGLITALNVAALRGVRVEIVLPEHSNLPVVDWASRAGWWQVLERGCRIWLTPAPFDHAKLMIVDGSWALIGGSNWDPRSLRLNFEMDLEVRDAGLVAELTALAWERMSGARAVSLADMDGRSYPIRLRDGIARLFTPLL